MKVYQAIHAILSEFAQEGGIPKDRQNTDQGYSYRGIDDVYAALSHKQAKHKLLIFPQGEERAIQEGTTSGGKVFSRTMISVTFKFVSAEDGTSEFAKVFGESIDYGDKGANKAHSAAFKLLCFQVFCIPCGDRTIDIESADHDIADTKPMQTTQRTSAPESGASIYCPKCGKSGACIIKNNFGPQKWACYGRKGGCGFKFDEDAQYSEGGEAQEWQTQ